MRVRFKRMFITPAGERLRSPGPYVLKDDGFDTLPSDAEVWLGDAKGWVKRRDLTAGLPKDAKGSGPPAAQPAPRQVMRPEPEPPKTLLAEDDE